MLCRKRCSLSNYHHILKASHQVSSHQPAVLCATPLPVSAILMSDHSTPLYHAMQPSLLSAPSPNVPMCFSDECNLQPCTTGPSGPSLVTCGTKTPSGKQQESPPYEAQGPSACRHTAGWQCLRQLAPPKRQNHQRQISSGLRWRQLQSASDGAAQDSVLELQAARPGGHSGDRFTQHLCTASLPTQWSISPVARQGWLQQHSVVHHACSGC